ncbi:response regulator [Microbacterium testaceum]|uniref:Two component transcriptional regulator, LuxR family n=1 Tax=Microbacterium testaceum (strain StLB037) TaxID=979556 RepID=A0A1H0RAW1_MICTS|nr:response regulator transcription factor [Microbacterium testaceum]SDP26703.1 two component transcriptional regulator, LuxR family [Microbacterium testaceum StLB037]
MIRVVVVDDEALVRSGFAFILNAADDIEVVAAVDGPDALDAIRALRPDVVLLDIRMPGLTGLEILAEVRGDDDPPVVGILTTFAADESIARALREGATGFLVKDTDPEHLAAMVRSLAAGGVVLSPEVSRALVDGFSGGPDLDSARRVALLTERERDVLECLPTGDSNAEIGRRLHLSSATVKDHVSSILSKLSVSSRVEAALIAERAGSPASRR